MLTESVVNKIKVYALPGTMCNERLWQPLQNLLKGEVELVHIPLPMNKNLDELASWLNEVLSEDKINLLGFSLGGYLAVKFAVKYPGKINKLFIVANTPGELSDTEIKQRQAILDIVRPDSYKGVSEKRAKQLLDNNNHNQNDINTIKLMDAELGAQQLISQLTYTTQRRDLLADISLLNLPIYFYYSEQDALINTSWLADLQANSTLCQVTPVPGSSHMLPLEQPQQLAKWLSERL